VQHPDLLFSRLYQVVKLRCARSYLLLLLVLSTSCGSDAEEKTSPEVLPDETEAMVERLQELVTNGNPQHLYHWNGKLAEKWLAKIKTGTKQEQMNAWFEYCRQKLYAGDSDAVIEELEGYLNQANQPYEELLNKQTRILFDLLAQAYLRSGEQKNCQLAHTPYSCILPLQEGGLHQHKEGSEKALDMYSMLYRKFPNNKYKWLLNVAAMTLGKHPSDMEPSEVIGFPNWQTEASDFPRFEEIAMNLNVAVNGLSGGVVAEDFNNDGWIDLFATSYGMEDQVKLFMNDAKGGFTDQTDQSGLLGIVSGLNCIQADYNNDGFKDVLVLRGAWLGKGGNHPNSLLRNNGDGTFSDVTESSGLLSFHPTQTATWLDFNQDGHIDLFIGNESKKGQPHPCELFQNLGDGTFKNASDQVGLAQIKGFVKGVTSGDIDNDGWPDIYISVLGGKNLLFRNSEGVFDEIGQSAGVQDPFFSFPTWFWDVNNDGFQDIFTCGYDLRNLDDLAADYANELNDSPVLTEKPKLFINNGDLTFTEQSESYGIAKTMYGMGANYGDLDNDGLLDFYVGTGAPDFGSIVPNRMFRNVDGTRFEEVTSSGNFGHIQKGHGIAFADFDRDGDQDIYAVMGGAYEGDVFTNILYENPISKHNWITIELEGRSVNRAALGTRIELKLDNGEKLFRTVTSGGSFGASPLQQEIGLGDAKLIETLIIHWSPDKSTSYSDISANQKIRISEDSDSPKALDYQPVPFRKSSHMHHHH